MPTYFLKLLDLPGGKGNGLPYEPKAYVALKNPDKQKKYGKNQKEEEFTVITNECVSFSEFEGQINILIKELNIIKKQGKKFFNKENKI